MGKSRKISGAKVMRVRHSADIGSDADRGRRCPTRPELASPVPTSPTERLDYIAAMVQELKTMSAQANCQTLAGLLDLAYREAKQRRRGCQ